MLKQNLVKSQFKKLIVLLFSVSLLLSNSFGKELVKYIPEMENAFKKGIKLYQTHEYKKSSLIFQKLAEYQPEHQRITISQLMYGKSLMRLGNYRNAILMLRDFVNGWPRSRYVENARYEMGSSFFMLGNLLAAAREFLWVYENGEHPNLVPKAKIIAEYLLEINLSRDQIQTLYGELPGEKASGLLVLKLAEKQTAAGNLNTAINTIIDFLNESPRNEYVPQLEVFLDKIRQNVQPGLKIGVILPLRSGYIEDGKGILGGIRFALKEFNENYNQKIDLVIRDSGSNIVKAVKSAQELIQDENIMAIIGELESDICAAVAVTAGQAQVPLLAPIASQNGLASLNEYSFQANSDLYERGRQLAKYAIENLNMKTFATLAPADDYGREMTDGFTTTIEKLGGTIVAPPKWYFQGSKNLSRQLRSIRATGFELLRQDSAWVRENSMLLAKAVIDTFLVPITSIDGLFCPVYTEELQYIGPQCASLNLRSRLLGGDYWFDLEVLRAHQGYLNGSIFVSDYYVDEYNPDYRRFRTNYRIKMGKDFGRMEAFGYDLMKAILEVIHNHNVNTRTKFRERLETLQNIEGIKGAITWRGNQRVNKEVNILEYNTGLIHKLK